jgi:hypothetical protein
MTAPRGRGRLVLAHRPQELRLHAAKAAFRAELGEVERLCPPIYSREI